MSASSHPVAVIGAGPVGLATAGHLQARGLTSRIFEAGPTIGHNIRQWGHVQLFSPWSMNIDDQAARALADTGWASPPGDQYPTGSEFVDAYLEPLAQLPMIADNLHLNTRVEAITRARHDRMKSAGREDEPYVLRVADADGERDVLAGAVIDATGTFQSPAGLGCHGLPALGEAALDDRIDYGLPDVLGHQRARYANRRVLVVGGGHSALTMLRDLAELADTAPDTQVLWALRRPSLAGMFDAIDDDPLPQRGRLVQAVGDAVNRGIIEPWCDLQITGVEQTGDGVRVQAHNRTGPAVDRIVAATGLRPDTAMLAEVRVALDPVIQAPTALAELIDPNVHSCLSVSEHGESELRHPDAGLYIAGIKSYGRAGAFLLQTGYRQVESIAAALADPAGGDQPTIQASACGR